MFSSKISCDILYVLFLDVCWMKVPSNPYFTRVVSIIKLWIIQLIDVKLKTSNIYYLDFFKSKNLELQIFSWTKIAVDYQYYRM